jgi:hypothetical protein
VKNRKIAVVVLLLLLAVAVLPIQASAELTVVAVKNAQYSTVKWNSQDRLEKNFRLANGKYEKQGPEGPTDVESLSVGKIALGDLNGDGKKDGAVILFYNTGGSGTVVQVAAVLDVNGQPRHVASRNFWGIARRLRV